MRVLRALRNSERAWGDRGQLVRGTGDMRKGGHPAFLRLSTAWLLRPANLSLGHGGQGATWWKPISPTVMQKMIFFGIKNRNQRKYVANLNEGF